MGWDRMGGDGMGFGMGWDEMKRDGVKGDGHSLMAQLGLPKLSVAETNPSGQVHE